MQHNPEECKICSQMHLLQVQVGISLSFAVRMAVPIVAVRVDTTEVVGRAEAHLAGRMVAVTQVVAHTAAVVRMVAEAAVDRAAVVVATQAVADADVNQIRDCGPVTGGPQSSLLPI
jgi:hypothetical protein